MQNFLKISFHSRQLLLMRIGIRSAMELHGRLFLPTRFVCIVWIFGGGGLWFKWVTILEF